MALLKRKPSFQYHSHDRLLLLTYPLPERIEITRQTIVEHFTMSRTDILAPAVAEPERKRKKADHQEKEITEAEERKTSIADIWRQIHGQDDWPGMLDPINPHLRRELIRYGEMAQACYDAFDKDPYSKYCGSCKYKPRDLFKRLGLENCGYEVTCYLYSTYSVKFSKFFQRCFHTQGWSQEANWIGYVAVSNDETSTYLGRRDIMIAWRGTVTKLEWIADMMDFLKPVSKHGIPSRDPTVQAEAGFLHLYTDKSSKCRFSKYSAREQILAEVNRFKQKYRKEELSITITGHSLGSALATINAYDIVETGLAIKEDRRAMPITVFSFSGPRVGNARFKERVEGLGVKVLRVVNVHDKVPLAPGIFFNEHTNPALGNIGNLTPWNYFHVGEELALDHKVSPSLKETRDLGCLHNLEALLHLLDGCHGKGSRFWSAGGRDCALVNKEADFLLDDLMIPPYWSQPENKGLVKDQFGHWVKPKSDDRDDHLPPQDIDVQLLQLGLRRLNYKQIQSSVLTRGNTI